MVPPPPNTERSHPPRCTSTTGIKNANDDEEIQQINHDACASALGFAADTRRSRKLKDIKELAGVRARPPTGTHHVGGAVKLGR